jgi:hypothetical protein
VKVTILTDDQRSDAWRSARLGRLTGSRAKDILKSIRSGGEAAARRDYRLQLVCERLTGRADEDGYVSAEMQRGTDMEPAALAAYEAETGQIVQATGFLSADGLMVGCSLDGHVGDFAGIVELKCPKSATHLGYIREGLMPAAHLPQLRHNLWVSGAEWADFCSFDDRLPEDLQLFRVRVTREEAKLDDYEKEARAFLAEVDRELEALIALRKRSAA